ncbi:hypothetical protein A2U01_0108140, partial [Trifolium medium]|nr:hypothetical protein [Trifolium medium]
MLMISCEKTRDNRSSWPVLLHHRHRLNDSCLMLPHIHSLLLLRLTLKKVFTSGP